MWRQRVACRQHQRNGISAHQHQRHGVKYGGMAANQRHGGNEIIKAKAAIMAAAKNVL